MKPILHCHLMGGLGNQLFQIFAAAAEALKSQRDLQCHFVSSGTPRRSQNGLLQHCTDKPKDPTFVRFQEKNCHRAETIIQGPKVEMYGYFQSPVYFEDVFPDVLKILQIERPLRAVQTGTAIHIRRTDFQTSASHELLTMNQYALQLQNMPRPQIVFTDSKDAFIQDFCLQFNASVYNSNADVPELDEFWTLAHFDFIVLSNSTFAWWAARFALHRNPNAVIRECSQYTRDPTSQIPLPKNK